MADITVVARPSIAIIGMHIRTTLEKAPVECALLWREEFGPRLKRDFAFCAKETYGISWIVDEKNGMFDYWAALPAQENCPVPTGMSRARLPEGLYAQLAVSAIDKISEASACVLSEWLPRQRAYCANTQAPSYELYPADYLQTGSFVIFFPILAKS